MINVYVRFTLKSLFSLPIYVKVSNISNSSLKIVMQASQGSPVFQFLCILVNQLSKGTIQTLLRMTDIIIVFCTHAFRFHNIYILYLTNTSCIIYHYMFGLRKYIGSLKFIYIRQVAADFSAFHYCVIHLRNQINK